MPWLAAAAGHHRFSGSKGRIVPRSRRSCSQGACSSYLARLRTSRRGWRVCVSSASGGRVAPRRKARWRRRRRGAREAPQQRRKAVRAGDVRADVPRARDVPVATPIPAICARVWLKVAANACKV
jgi:hypothetical protein